MPGVTPVERSTSGDGRTADSIALVGENVRSCGPCWQLPNFIKPHLPGLFVLPAYKLEPAHEPGPLSPRLGEHGK